MDSTPSPSPAWICVDSVDSASRTESVEEAADGTEGTEFVAETQPLQRSKAQNLSQRHSLFNVQRRRIC